MLLKIGRKHVVLGGTIVAIFSLSLLGSGFFFIETIPTLANYLILFGLGIFMANFGLTLGPVTWLYIAEVLEPIFIPITTFINWVSASIITTMFPILK